LPDIDDVYKKHTVVGIGVKGWCNGIDTLGVPYVNKYQNDGTFDGNPNNYLVGKVFRARKTKRGGGSK